MFMGHFWVCHHNPPFFPIVQRRHDADVLPPSASRFLCELSWTMDIIIFIISRIVSAGGHDGSWVSMWAMCGGQTRYGHNFSSDRCQSEINVTWEMNASTQPSPWTVSITGEQRGRDYILSRTKSMILFITHVSCPLRGPVLLNLPYWGLFSELEISGTQSHFYWIPGDNKIWRTDYD